MKQIKKKTDKFNLVSSQGNSQSNLTSGKQGNTTTYETSGLQSVASKGSLRLAQTQSTNALNKFHSQSQLNLTSSAMASSKDLGAEAERRRLKKESEMLTHLEEQITSD